uniref:PEROXIDASE_4 domain-containing protein n=1 Tax=Macrostomum lignano TaxID=282301 RepID=A0A1I8FQE4_9PLAT
KAKTKHQNAEAGPFVFPTNQKFASRSALFDKNGDGSASARRRSARLCAASARCPATPSCRRWCVRSTRRQRACIEFNEFAAMMAERYLIGVRAAQAMRETCARLF